MYTVGAHIVSQLTGFYQRFVAERIFTPLGMTTSTYLYREANATGHMSQAWDDAGRRIPYWIPDSEDGILDGPAGVISSVADLVCSASHVILGRIFICFAGQMD